VTGTTCHDLVIIGDGPAGLALGAAAVDVGLDVVVVGDDRPWLATYGTWADDVPGFEPAFAASSPIDVVTLDRRRLGRAYATFDHTALRLLIDRAPRHLGRMTSVQHHDDHATVVLADGERVRGRLVVDAAGARVRPGAEVAAQTAYGLVFDHRPDVVDGDAAVLMDWRSPGARWRDDPTFLYVIPLGGGRWLVEETSLARARPMPHDELRARLASRLGDDLTAQAEAVELVHIPMRSGVPDRSSLTIGFGAAARYVHPATGYSVAASLRAAPRVATAVRESLSAKTATSDPRSRHERVWEAVWPSSQRDARALHDYGLDALLRLPAADVQAFFDAFFALPEALWSSYLRVDTDASTVSRVMTQVFRSVPWSVRRRLATGSPLPLLRLLR
jgi:lycopene beta-cyclase